MCDPWSPELPELWSSIDETVAKYSNGTTLRGGADLNIGATETPAGDSPLWLACDTTDGHAPIPVAPIPATFAPPPAPPPAPPADGAVLLLAPPVWRRKNNNTRRRPVRRG